MDKIVLVIKRTEKVQTNVHLTQKVRRKKVDFILLEALLFENSDKLLSKKFNKS